MYKLITEPWDDERNKSFAQVMVAINDVDTMQNFLRDIMIDRELAEIASRLQAAAMLKAGSTYVAIVQQTKLSSRTVARISGWLKDGPKGYEAVLELAKNHHIHLLPARN